MVIFHYKGKKAYIDRTLKNELDKKVLPQLLKKDKDVVFIVDGKERGGKCQPAGSKILMADGSWKNIEDIKIEEEVISPQINGRTIFSKVKNITSWFSEENYDIIELNKKRRKLYSCSSNHIIPINKISSHRFYKEERRWREWKLINYEAKELSKRCAEFKKNITSPSTPLIKSFKNRENCRIEPYSLGVFLGDGCFSSTKNNNGWKKRYVNITSADFEILEEVSKHYSIMSIIKKEGTIAKSYFFSLNGDFSKLLSEYGLEGKSSGSKSIPEQAIYSDSEYRKRLLTGLIDTDGYFKNGGYSITTKSKKLAEDIYFLVRSLGGRGEIRKVIKGIKRIGFKGEYYRVSFYLGNLKLLLMTKRKINNKKNFYLSANRVSIDLIKSKPSMVYGFELDSPSQFYITDNWMITHNSKLADILGGYAAGFLKTDYSLDNMCMTPEEFRNFVQNCPKRSVVIYDEAHRGMGSRRALSEVNNLLLDLMMEMGQKNLFVMIVIPTFFMLDRYPALFRTKGLFHIYERHGMRGNWVYFNEKNKFNLYLLGKKLFNYNCMKWPKLRGRYFEDYIVDETEYRAKKARAFKDRPKFTKVEVLVEQRNNLIYAIYHLMDNPSSKKVSALLKKYNVKIGDGPIRGILIERRRELPEISILDSI